METAPRAPAAAAPAPESPSSLATSWPRCAQLATAFLLGVAATLLLVHAGGSLRWGARPSELDRPAVPAYRIDLNRASRAELLQVPGLGPALADRIADHQRRNGDFRNLDELRQVAGVGPATLERLRPWLCVAEVADATAVVERRSLYPPATMEPEPRPAAGRKEAALSGPIDINRANVAEFQKLPGIGPVLSQRIVDERGKRPFKSVDDLRRVSGIGPKILERMRPYVMVAVEPVVTADPTETASERP